MDTPERSSHPPSSTFPDMTKEATYATSASPIDAVVLAAGQAPYAEIAHAADHVLLDLYRRAAGQYH